MTRYASVVDLRLKENLVTRIMIRGHTRHIGHRLSTNPNTIPNNSRKSVQNATLNSNYSCNYGMGLHRNNFAP